MSRPARPEAIRVSIELLEALRPALAGGMRRRGGGFSGPGRWDAVVTVELAQQLMAMGFARLAVGADGAERLVLADD